MTRRGLLAPLLATVATAACAPLIGEGGSAPVPIGPPGWRTARTAYGADPRQTLRLYRPARADGSPILILLPDGAPQAADERTADERTARDLAERGFVVALADRRAAPGSPYPAFIADGASAVAWAARRAEDMGGDAGRIGVLGLGEGGRAALMLALDRRYLATAGAPGAVRAAAALGAPDKPDATFTDPSAYEGARDGTLVWRGAADDRTKAVAFLRGALS
ncbi:alpha/beta hydrolase [Brevundimonas sp. NPDC055814]